MEIGFEIQSRAIKETPAAEKKSPHLKLPDSNFATS